MVATLSARALGPYASLMAIKPRPIADVVPRVPRFFVSMAAGCIAIGEHERPGYPGDRRSLAQRSVRGEDGVMDRDGFADFLRARRGPQPSVSMLSALARTLRLSLDERDHLFRLAGHPAPERTAGSTFVRPALLHVLDQLDDCAAFVASDLEVVPAQNRLSILLMGDFRALGT